MIQLALRRFLLDFSMRWLNEPSNLRRAINAIAIVIAKLIDIICNIVCWCIICTGAVVRWAWPAPLEFFYFWLDHPEDSDNPHVFVISGEPDRDSANERAKRVIRKKFDAGLTIDTRCYPTTKGIMACGSPVEYFKNSGFFWGG